MGEKSLSPVGLLPLLRLCEECDSLIDHQDKIKVLSLTHANLHKVLAELEDIVVLPSRADMVLGLMDDPANLLPVFEALTVLEGTAENAKQAWNRCDRTPLGVVGMPCRQCGTSLFVAQG